MPSKRVKDVANATVGVFRKLELNGKIKWGGFKLKLEEIREKLYYGNYQLLVLFSFTDGLHDDCSSSGVDISFHEN